MTIYHDTAPRPGRMAYVTTTISGDQLQLEHWTRYFDIEPTFFVEKDKRFITPTGKLSSGIGKTNIWGFSTKGIILDDALTPHLNYLISHLQLPRPDLKARLDTDHLTFRFTCFWANFTHDRIPVIEGEVEKIINESGGILLIDEYS